MYVIARFAIDRAEAAHWNVCISLCHGIAFMAMDIQGRLDDVGSPCIPREYQVLALEDVM